MPTVKFPPLTVEDAVDYLQASMSLNQIMSLTDIKKENISDLYYSLGAYARDILGLWSGNEELIESCRSISGNNDLDADDASRLILEALWERLQTADTLGMNDNGKMDVAGSKDGEDMSPKETVDLTADLKELLMSEVIQSKALIDLLDRKGIITKQELLGEMKRVRASIPKPSP